MVKSVMEIGFTFFFAGGLLGLACLLLGIKSNFPIGMAAMGSAFIICDAFMQSLERFCYKVVG